MSEDQVQPADTRTIDSVLLYDGLCGLCNGVVRFVLARDRRGTLRFSPLQGDYAAALAERYPWIREADTFVLIEPAAEQSEPAHLRVRSDAALALAAYVGGAWRLAVILRAVPRFIRDAVYDAVARMRYRRFGRYDSCPLPPADVRSRFLP